MGFSAHYRTRSFGQSKLETRVDLNSLFLTGDLPADQRSLGRVKVSFLPNYYPSN
jgi:hypothetical protein